jgi:hypothetical protein
MTISNQVLRARNNTPPIPEHSAFHVKQRLGFVAEKA